jgi:hypothetical protein
MAKKEEKKDNTRRNLTYAGMIGGAFYLLGTSVAGIALAAYPAIQLAKNLSR